MQTVNKDAIGAKLYINMGEDISANTALAATLQPESGSKISVTPTLGTSDIWVQDVLYLANNYVTYTTTDGVFDNYTGRYRMKAVVTLPTKTISIDYELFQVVE